MKEKQQLKDRILAAAGSKKAQLVLKNAKVVNVFTQQVEETSVAISDGWIVGIGEYQGEREEDLKGAYLCPGFLDGHIHLESSMVAPAEFERMILPRGTTGVITDPHEISNVAGLAGIRYMLEATKNLKLDVFLMLPSCVPSTQLDEAGATLTADLLLPLYGEPRVLGLAEMMNAFGTVNGDPEILNKILDAATAGKIIDGHGPGLRGKGLNAYVTAGVTSDHECSWAEEAMEKLSRGQWIMIREGTAAQNLKELIPLCKEPYFHRCMFVTDDKHPGDILTLGHMDGILRKAVSLGADPIAAIKMVTLHPASYFGLKQVGAVAPGYRADLVVLSDLTDFTVQQVYKNGKLAAKNGELLEPSQGTIREEAYPEVFDSFHLEEVKERCFAVTPKGNQVRVICLTPHELLTTEKIIGWTEKPGFSPGVDLGQDVIKMAVLERYHNTGHVGIGFLGGYGLQAGAVATSVAHDSHNLIVAGVNDADMALAANTVRKNRGGLAVVKDGVVLGQLALPIGGLMSDQGASQVEQGLGQLKELAYAMGISKSIDPFMTLAFVSLPVIPKLRLNTYGLVGVELQKILEVTY